ncbi:MAG: helix-turn-helix transcriptional regulator [Desulfovibrionaceae bacterium]
MKNAYTAMDIENLKMIGSFFRGLRLEKGLSIEQLAEIANLNRNYLGEVERGERNISLINLIRLAKAHGLPLREIFPKNL